MLRQERLGTARALFLQRRQECALGVELRGSPELHELVGYDPMRAHLRPTRAFPAAGIGGLPQERDRSKDHS